MIEFTLGVLVGWLFTGALLYRRVRRLFGEEAASVFSSKRRLIP